MVVGHGSSWYGGVKVLVWGMVMWGIVVWGYGRILYCSVVYGGVMC